MSDNLTVSMINKMKVSELQSELTERRLDTKGTKQVLINRLISSLEIAEPAQDERQDDSKDESQSSPNELHQNYHHPNSFENAIRDIRLQLNILQCKFEDYKTEMSNDALRAESLRDENKRLTNENKMNFLINLKTIYI